MYKLRHIPAIVLWMFSLHADAQYTPAIRSVRPGVTIGPNTVGKGIVQFHFGGYKGWDGRSDDTSAYYNKFTYANAIVCYGITNRLELDLLAETRKDNIDINNQEIPASGLSLAALGFRYTITEGNISGPSIGFQGLLKLNTQSPDYRTSNIAPRALLLLGYEPTYIISMSANVGIDFSGNNSEPTGLYSFKTNFRLAPILGTYIETFGTYNQRYVYNNIGVGMYYFLTNNLQVDVSGGYGIRKDQYRGFISLGLAFRFATSRIPDQIEYDKYSE